MLVATTAPNMVGIATIQDSARVDGGAGPGPGSSAAAHSHRGHTHVIDKNPSRVYKLLLAGGLAGAVSRSATAPIDRVKMILQVQEDVRGMSLREGIQKIAAEGSFKAYFRGNGANVVKIAPETAMKLTLNDKFKLIVAQDLDNITPSERLVSGGMAGAVAQGLLYPLDTVRTRLAVCPKDAYKGIYPTMCRIWTEEGFCALYRGITPNMLGILPYAGVDIALFEMFKEELLDRHEGNPPHLSILMAGMASSTIAQLISYPLALIRTRLQAQGAHGVAAKYTGMLDVAVQTVRREGFKGLYKGLLPNLFKLAPAAGISWFIFEETKRMLGVDPRS